MEYPTLNVKQKSRQMSDAFLGYNHNLRIGDGEFYDMKNMTSDYYPVLAPRGNRGVYKDGINAKAIIGRDLIAEHAEVNAKLSDELCYVDGSAFVINGERIEMGLSDEPKQLVSMGAYIIIMPDKKWISTQSWADKYDEGYFLDSGQGDIDEVHSTTEKVTFSLCTLTGEDYDIVSSRKEEPLKTDGAVWCDPSTTPPTLKKYSEAQKMWVSIPTTYVKIKSRGIGHNLNQYDGVEISGIKANGWENLNGSHTLWGCNEQEIIITGIPNEMDAGIPNEQTDAIKASAIGLPSTSMIPPPTA